VVDLVQEGELDRSRCAMEAGLAIGAAVTNRATGFAIGAEERLAMQ